MSKNNLWLVFFALAPLATLGCDKSNNSYCDATHTCASGRSCDLTTNECVASQDLGTPDLGSGDQGGSGDGGESGCAPACTGTTPICQAPTCVSCAQATDGEAACAAAAATTPHCLLTGADTGSCVECRDDNDCGTATARFCDATTHTCRGCVADSECTSLVCDETPGSATRGECIDKGQIVYVDVTGKCNNPPTNTGDFGSPLCLINDAEKVKNKSVIHLATGTYLSQAVKFNNAGSWTLVGDTGAIIQELTVNTPALQVQGTTSLVVRNLSIFGSIGTSHGIDSSGTVTLTVLQSTIQGNGGYGISSGPGCTLIVDRTKIESNVQGGVVVTGGFDIRNSMIVVNGRNTGPSGGGVSIKSPAGMTAGFINNTVADNTGSGLGSGIACMNPVTLLDTVLYHNRENSGFTITEIAGNCTTLYSATDDATDAARSGANNVDLSTTGPAFAATDDYHLMSTSPCKDKGTDSGTNDHDFDGQPRPDPTTMKVDIGADEVQ